MRHSPSKVKAASAWGWEEARTVGYALGVGGLLVVVVVGLLALRAWLRRGSEVRGPCPGCGTFAAAGAKCPACGTLIPGNGRGQETPVPTTYRPGNDRSRPEPAAGEAGQKETELAAQSLADSLRISFGILKFIMIALATVFAFSGLYSVDEGTIAVHVRLGKILGEPGEQVVEPGGPYFAFPSPVDEVVRVPTTLQEVGVDTAFWFGSGGGEDHKEGALRPGVDGSLITGDKNVVHGRWTITYKIPYNPQDPEEVDAPKLFAQRVGSKERADEIVRYAAEQAIVRVVSQTVVDNFIRGDINNEVVRELAQAALDRIQTGISITAVSQRDYTVPLRVLPDFQAVNKAESEKALSIEKAERFRAEVLNKVAGKGYPALLEAIDAYERARQSGNPDAVGSADARISELLLSPDTGGRVAEIINSAKTYRTEVVEYVRGAAGRFSRLVDQHDENPRIIRDRMRQDAIEQVLNGDVETFYLPPGEKVIYLEMNRKPRQP